MNTLFRKLFAAALLLGLSTLALAADYPKVIQNNAINRGMKVEKTFPAASGMTGWLLSGKGQYMIVFTTPDNKALLAGALFDENGRDLLAAYRDKYIPRPDFEALFKELEKAPYVAEGSVSTPRSLLYVIYDADCPYCHLAWKMFQPYEKAGLRVHWIPVAFLSPTSMPKAIEALAAHDPTAAFRRIMQKFGQNYDPPAGLDAGTKPDIAAKIQSNLALMQKFGITGTPGVIWKDKTGKVFVKSGLPRLSELPAMTGLPEQKVDDPELAKFR